MARSGFPAPIFCAPRAETVDSMEDGIKEEKADYFLHNADRRRVVQAALIGDDRDDDKGDLDEPVLKRNGDADLQDLRHHRALRPKVASCAETMLFRFKITARDTATLMAWESVVPSAAPAGPSPRAPMNR